MRCRRKIKKQRRLMFISLFIMLLGLSIGYAAFGASINLNVKGNVRKTTAVEFLKTNIVTTGDGLYKDIYDDNRYIYRGASPNNYIKLGNDMYRIIAIESDKTLKVIKNGIIGTIAFDSAGYRDKASDGSAGSYCSLSNNGCNAWSINNNFMFGSYTGTVLKDAELNTYLNNEWYAHLDYSSFIISHDFNIGMVNYEDADMSNSINNEKKYIIKSKIGLMNITDYVKASTNTVCKSVKAYRGDETCYSRSEDYNWIYKDIVQNGNYPWTITPTSVTNATVLNLSSPQGNIIVNVADVEAGIAPVFYLNSNIVLKGDGSSISPYVPSFVD